MSGYESLTPGHLDPYARLAQRVASMEQQLDAIMRTAAAGRATEALDELQANRDATWKPLTLLNGFTHTAGPYFAPPSYYVDSFGRVFLRGTFQNNASAKSAQTPICVVPLEASPYYGHTFPSSSIEAPFLTVLGAQDPATRGTIWTGAVPAFNFLSFDAMQFRVNG